MDRTLSYSISKEDIGGILKSFLLFLESLNFKETLLVLQEESFDLGYSKSSDKLFMVTSSTTESQTINPVSKINQTEFPFVTDENAYVLESSVCEIHDKQGEAPKPSVLVYFTDTKRFYKHVSDGSDENAHQSCTIIGQNQGQDEKYHNKSFQFLTAFRKDKCTNTENNNLPRKEALSPRYENNQTGNVKAKVNSPEMVQNTAKVTREDIALNGEHFNKEYLDLQRNLVTLQNDHKKLMGVATELLTALQTSVEGQSQKFNNLLEKCKQAYPDIFKLVDRNDRGDDGFPNRTNLNEAKEVSNQNAADFHDGKLPKEEMRFHHFSEQNEQERINSKPDDFETKTEHDIATKLDSLAKTERMLSFFLHVDYRKLKKDLLHGNVEKRMLLLQALRWRITKSLPESRIKVINAFIKHDLLDLYSGNMPLTLLESLYCPMHLQTPHQLQESVARLVNAFASLKLGRDYLCQDDRLLLDLLLPLILNPSHRKIKLSSTTRAMLLATLQKLSLRNRQRQHMISSGLVEHLVTFLNDNYQTVSGYCLEYCSALLMNLCLHNEARDRCSVKAGEVVQLLINLLKTKNADCTPYVNGAMYSLLGNTKINQEARKMQLKKCIRQHIVDCMNDENLKQLEFIISAHLEGEVNQSEELDLTEEGEDEVDLLEEELDEYDMVHNSINGEAVLYEYRLEHEQADLEAGARLNFLNRLATPRQRPTSYKSDGTDRNTIDLPHPSRCSMESGENTHAQQTYRDTAKNLNKSQPHEYCVGDDGCTRRCFTPSSPEDSFSEVTKQFYHKPSAKRGIFDRKKVKFSRKYTLMKRDYPTLERKPAKYKTAATSVCYKCCYNTTPQNMYSRVCKNIEQGTNTEANFGDHFKHEDPNKYRCSCYEMMKTYIENNNISDKTIKDEFERLNNLPNLSNKSHLRRNFNRETTSADRENGEQNNYKTVFQSRPKIIRTPQNKFK